MGIIAAALIAAHSQGIGMGVNNVGDLPDWVAFPALPQSHWEPCREDGNSAHHGKSNYQSYPFRRCHC